jgi:arylsulfatase A-like enzyme
MKHKTLLATSIASLSLFSINAQENKQTPNVIFILADDFGYSDVQYNGGAGGFYETPNINQMKNDGVRFTSFYPGGPNSAPSRACIMSGMYTPRTKIYQPSARSKGKIDNMRWYVPARGRKNNRQYPTIEITEDLNPDVVSLAELMNRANYRTCRIGKWHLGKDLQGFDESTYDGFETKHKKFYNDPYATDRMTKSALNFIERSKGNPFFLFFSTWDVHSPWKAKPELVEKYKKKWKTWNDKSVKWSPVYAAMIEQVDNAVGQIRKKIIDLGLSKNTLIVFATDNGGVASITTNKPLKGAKGALYEGGVRTPFVAVWEGVTNPNSVSEVPVTGVDFMPTFAELSNQKLPTQIVDGKSFVSNLETESDAYERPIFWHYPLYLVGKSKQTKIGLESDMLSPIYKTNKLYWRAVPASAIRKGDWKLIYFYEYDKYELYNLKNDLSETTDLSEQNKAKVEELYAMLKNWTKETGADIPQTLNPEFRK